jgi:hypothetical protein
MSFILRDEIQQNTAGVDSNRAVRVNIYRGLDSISTSNPLPVEGYDSRQILNDILKELKIMNVHLQKITDEHIEKSEVE